MPPAINRRAVERLSSSVTLKTPDEVKSSCNTNRFTGESSNISQVSNTDYQLLSPSKRKTNKQPGVLPNVKRLQAKSSCVLLARNKEYHQNSNLPWKPFIPQSNLPEDASSSQATHASISDDSAQNAYDFFGFDNAEAMGYSLTPGNQPSRHQRKKANQWRTWQNTIIPALVHPLLELRAMHSQTPTNDIDSKINCQCGMSTSQIPITCIRWSVITTILVTLCPCIEVSQQLISNGLFPCAPYRPSLAVAIDLLDFVCELNTYQAPNNSAWCHAFMAYHRKRENTLEFSFDSLKRRFGNAIFWYSVLDNTVNKYLDNFSTTSLLRAQHISSSINGPNPINNPDSSGTATVSQTSSDDGTDLIPSEPVHVTPITVNDLLGQTLGVFNSEYEPTETQASLYLQRRCPCCFGGELSGEQALMQEPGTTLASKSPTIIVQIDANFGQKRHHGKQDFPVRHPYTRFLSEDAVSAMEAEVQTLRPDRDSTKKKKKNTESFEDQMEATGLPTSVLDACEKTFKAADDRREKASTQFFSETGLMAIICRHDHVLYVTNMKSAGEKQFYAFALIDAVFRNLPDDKQITMGVLYDIGCQTHRSVTKWGFLSKYQERLTFGVSIFHAYGHEWPCQLVYNPRKREGFGLSNGEGCERLWSSLKELIPNLHITGFHKRLFLLDERMQSNYCRALSKMGLWLLRNYTVAENKLAESQNVLDTLGIPEQSLREGWHAQIIAQTKPLPSQSRSRAQTVIQGTLRLRQEVHRLQENIKSLETECLRFFSGSSHEPEHIGSVEEIDIMLTDLRARFRTVFSSYQNCLSALGVDEKRQLSLLLTNKYLSLRMNVRAKKQHIRERLRRRKMELAEVTKRSIPSVNDQKLTDHSEKAISKREPTILRLISEYNKGCSELVELIQRKQYPSGMIVLSPQMIDPKRVFSLEMDDSIWQDVGLEDDTNEIPQWLGDDDFQKGI